jgi:hypothetical protein
MEPHDEKKLKTLEIADEVRRFEIGLFWTRSLFFWGFSATALAAYGGALHAKATGFQFGAGCVGLVCATAWTLVNRGSKYWQENWERKADLAQVPIQLSVELFAAPERQPAIREGWLWRAKHFSVSGATIAFSDFTVLVWLGLILAATPLRVCIPLWAKEAGIFIVTFAFVVAILVFSSRSGRLDGLRRRLLGENQGEVEL